MSKILDSKSVTVSVKIYERLLAACPADFRREYGPAMTQLFRDQCRGAWSDARGRGLAGLWLRALLDLAKTSLVEHLANLRRRESVSKRIFRAFRADPKLRAAFFRVFAAVFAAALVCSALITFLTPRIYFSTTKLEVREDGQDMPVTKGPGNGQASQLLDPYFAITQFRIITSWGILSQVIANLNLQHVLAQQDQAGEPDWSLDQTYAWLYKQVYVAQTSGTKLIAISVRNPDPNLASNIANAIAGAYQEWRLQVHKRSEEPMPAIYSVTILDSAKASWNSVVRTKPEIFSTWILGGMVLALLAGGGGAWLASRCRPSSRDKNPTGTV